MVKADDKWKGPRVAGKDPKAIKRITCRHCTSIVEYIEADIKTKSYTVMGDSSGHREVKCPSCKQGIELPGSSW